MHDQETTRSPSEGKFEYLSRRERRERERQQRSGGGPSRWRRRALLWGGLVLVVGLIGIAMIAISSSTRLPTETGVLADPVTEADHSKGPPDAPVTLLEYSDFQCPACAAFGAIVQQALADPQLNGRVRFVYRSFPLVNIHARAELAARAAEAASLQGKFWEMHDKLFAGQRAWATLSDTAAREVFTGYASEIGLDGASFTVAIDSGDVRDRVRRQIDGAERSNINATPTFFINGVQMSPVRNFEEFRQNLIQALYANP